MTKTEKKHARRQLGAALEDMEIDLKKQLNALTFGDEALEQAAKHGLASRARVFYHFVYCNRRGEGLSKKDSDRIAYKAVRTGYEDDLKSTRFLKRLEKAVIELGEANAKSIS